MFAGSAGDLNEEEPNSVVGAHDIDQLDASLLTLSLVPKSRWQTLLNLDRIRERNRPIQPPEKPKAAPFFLGSSALGKDDHLLETAVPNDPQSPAVGDERSRISRLAAQKHPQSSISGLLSDFNLDPRCDPCRVIEHLTTLPPSAADLEIRSLSLREMPLFVRALTAQLGVRRQFELVNTWMNVFLKMHGDFVSEVEVLKEAVLAWWEAMKEEEKRLSNLVGYTRGVVEFLRSAR